MVLLVFGTCYSETFNSTTNDSKGESAVLLVFYASCSINSNWFKYDLQTLLNSKNDAAIDAVALLSKLRSIYFLLSRNVLKK